MEKAVEDFRKDLATLRTGRAHASLLDSIRVDYHGIADARESAWRAHRAGAQHDCHFSVGSERGRADR